MKKKLLIIILNLIIAVFAQASDNIAIVNISHLLQQMIYKTGVSINLENEFKDRANELQNIENDLQNKIQRLQHDSTIMKPNDRNKLEKDVMVQRQLFSQKAQSFEQDRQRRSNEEHNKLIVRIQDAIKNVAIRDNINLVIDASSIAFRSKDIKDITLDVLKQVK